MYISGYDTYAKLWITGKDTGNGTIRQAMYFFSDPGEAEKKAIELNEKKENKK